MERLGVRAVRTSALLLVFTASLVVALAQARSAYASDLQPRSLTVSDSRAGQSNVTYELSFRNTTSGTVGSISIDFCSNSAIIQDPCTPPAGFDASGANLVSQTGMTGFSIDPSSTNNHILLTRPPAVYGQFLATYTFLNIQNQTNGGSMYARVATYPTSDGTGQYADNGSMALYFPLELNVNAEVPPFLKFCLGESITAFDCTTATEPFSDMGNLGPLVTGAAQSQMVIATNAQDGYSMWVLGGTMTSGNNTIASMAAGGPSIKGTAQFGINLRANTAPVIGDDPVGPGVAIVNPLYFQQNQFRYVSGDELVTTNAPDDLRKYTVSYIVNVPANQPGGVYATTLTYVALANF